jgi:hypothetical protein
MGLGLTGSGQIVFVGTVVEVEEQSTILSAQQHHSLDAIVRMS